MASLANRPAEAADPGIDNRSQRFVIPKLDSVAERVAGRAKGRASNKSMLQSTPAPEIARCTYCRHDHRLNSYCCRVPSTWFRMPNRRDEELSSSPSRSESSDYEDSRAGSRESSKDDERSEESPEQGKTEEADPLEEHFASRKRLDKKETTLTLLPSTIKFFFKTVMKEGELTKEGREELAEKYHLEAKQFEKIKAPKLDDTALFRLGDKEFKNSRAGRLVSIHNRLYIKPNTHI